MKHTSGIYKITNPKGRVYIGSSINIEVRWSHYRNVEAINTQPKIYNSIKKYGVDSHLFEIIEECSDNMLHIRERYYQEYFDVINKGLNCKLVSTANKKSFHTTETRNKIGEGNRGKKRSPETIQRHKDSLKRNIENGWKMPTKGVRYEGKEYLNYLSQMPQAKIIVLEDTNGDIKYGPVGLSRCVEELKISRGSLLTSLDTDLPMLNIKNKEYLGCLVRKYQI